jgi:DNA polymerase (family 10)
MDNYVIADQLSLLAKLMDIHGENSFKAKSYSSAAFSIEKMENPISELSPEKIFKIRGIGESVGKKVIELLNDGEIEELKKYLSTTPSGILEMLNIKGLGPKKINTLWKELKIDTIEGLRIACEENLVAEKKGFGEKTQQKILDSIRFQQTNAGKYLYAQAEAFEQAFRTRLQNKFPKKKLEVTGTFRRQLEVIERLEYVTTIDKEELKKSIISEEIKMIAETSEEISFNAENTLLINFFVCKEDQFYAKLFETSCSPEFLEEWMLSTNITEDSFKDEESIFKKAKLEYIPPFLREKKEIIAQARKKDFSDILQPGEVRGLIHSHSNWSDGAYTIEDMAKELIKLGFEYLVISDHSKAAYYAGGLTEEKIREQHRYIDGLNEKFKPFRIFKSIECDILTDGSLDYDNKTLATFDLVIVSIHSNLDMDESKAMKRLLGAISNPYTTILGHMTGRRLLRRKGYPVDHKAIIDACAENNVVIEINANPQRLDMEWQWVDYALEKEVMLSVNPDAHSTDEFHNIKYGVFAGQKGGLTQKQNLSSFTLKEFERFLEKTRKKKGIS